MKRGNSFIYIANPSRIRTHLSERLDPKVQRRLPKPTSPCLPVTGEPVWGFCLHTIFPSQAGADPANHISLDFSNAFALLSASHPAVCSWPLPFLLRISSLGLSEILSPRLEAYPSHQKKTNSQLLVFAYFFS